jgi:sugar lactone lactonase YvrE
MSIHFHYKTLQILASLCSAKIDTMAKWIQNGITVAGGNGQGNALNQLNCPSGLCVDNGQTIYVADYGNHRILEWKSGATSGKVVAGGNGRGNRNDQLNDPTDVVVDNETDCLIICDYGNKRVVRWPRQNGTSGETLISNIDCSSLAMDNNGHLYVSDYTKHEVRRWKIGDANGVVVAGGNGAGNRLDQLSQPNYIFVDQDYSLYVSDGNNHRVMKWMKGAKEGIVVAGGHAYGNGLTQLYPHGLVVDQSGTVYVADVSNHRFMRWVKGAAQGTIVVGGAGQGGQANQFCQPCDVSLDREGNLYVADIGNHRVQKFNIELS